MNTFVQYETGTPSAYIEAAQLSYVMLAAVTNDVSRFNARPLEINIPMLASGQYDSAWIERVKTEDDTNFLVITARDLGATGLNFCFGRSGFNQRTAIASSRRVEPSTFVGLVLHESGHSVGLVEPHSDRHDNLTSFIGHCANDCAMQPVNNIDEMNSVIQKVLARPVHSGFCTDCTEQLAAR